MTGITGVDRDARPRRDVGFRIEEHGVDLAGAEHQQMASVDIERGPVREDLYRTLARIDLERDVIGHDDRVARLNSWIGIVRAADWEVVRAGGSRGWALGGGPGCGRPIGWIGGDGAPRDGGWQHPGPPGTAGRAGPGDTPRGGHPRTGAR